VVAVVLGAGLCLAAWAADDRPVEVNTQDEKVNYSVGYEVGKDFRRQQLGLSADALLRGMMDAASDGQLLMTPEDIEGILAEFREKQLATRQAESARLAEKGLDEGELFLASNARKEGVVVLPSGLQYRVFKEGTGKQPKATDTVTIRYRGRSIHGAEFDNSDATGGPVTLRVREVRMPGWREGLQLMKEGAHWELVVPSALGFEDRGPLKDRVVILDVELLKVGETEGAQTPRAGQGAAPP
jgi:FKBP-type peptidyl-prolyl cis-trans isomerase FklB